MSTKNSAIILYTTCTNKNQAQKLVNTLLEENLIACANVFAAGTSTYRWQKKIVSSRETYLLLKSSTQKKTALKKRLREIHPYDTPCIAELSLQHLNTDYQNWLLSSLKQEPARHKDPVS